MGLSLLNKTGADAPQNSRHRLLNKIRQREARVVVMGAGYVGLTIALEAARAGFPVICYEINGERVKSVAEGVSSLPGITDKELRELQASGKLQCTDQVQSLREADLILICVATPLGPAREPDVSQIKTAATCISHYLKSGTLVILESTSYPGTTEELVKPILESSGLKSEQDFWLAFSPERVDPGNTHFSLQNTPKIVAGVGPDSTALAETFYSQMVETIVKVSSPATAEMVKLYENIFRNINIAFANEMALLCDRMGLNIWEIIEAASTKPYGFMPFYPGPGPGGHCIPIDPHYLSWKARQQNFHCRFIELASDINDEMPRHVCARISEALNQNKKALKGANVLILGASYKPDIADARESPILELFPLLAKRGAQVSYNDPYVRLLQMANPGDYSAVEISPETLQSADCVVILTDHACYPYEIIAEHAPLVVDCKNALGRRGIDGQAKVFPL